MEDKEVCKEERDNSIPIDRGYAWVIVISTFALFTVAGGGFKCQGVLFVEVVDRFEGVYEPSTLLAVFTITYSISCVVGLVATHMILKIGHRANEMIGIISLSFSFIGLAYAPNLPALFIMYSLPAGFGTETIRMTSLLITAPYFLKRRALAIGLVASGAGFGSVVLPYIIRFLFDQMDFSGALVLYAGFHLQFLCLASLLRPISYYKRNAKKKVAKKDMTESKSSTDAESEETAFEIRPYEPDTLSIHSSAESLTAASMDIEEEKLETGKKTVVVVKETFAWRILLYPKLILIMISMVLFAMGLSVIYTCLPALGEEYGISRELVAMALVVAGGLETLGRILNGIFADRKIISATSQYAICIFVAGFLSLLCTVISGLPGVVLALVGISTMGMAVFNLLPLVMKDLIGEKNVTSGMGLQSAAQTVSFLSATYITAEIYDATGTWRTVYFFISGAMMLGSLVMWPYLIHRRCEAGQARNLSPS